MNAHECVFARRGAMVWVCAGCGADHLCGEGICDAVFYNSDHTEVCRLTGLCFAQRVCDEYIDASRGVANALDQAYFQKIKRDQQIKNRTIDITFITAFVRDMDFGLGLCERDRLELTQGTVRLWLEFIDRAVEKKVYIHRKDKRCFVVAVMFSLSRGLSSNMGCIVKEHPRFHFKKLNKKKHYASFKVSDIRAGQKLIMNVFLGNVVINVLSI